MGNGSHKEGPANADRLREKYAKRMRATQRAVDDARLPVSSPPPGSEPYRLDMDSVSEVTVGGEKGVVIKNRSPWLTVALAGMALVAFVAWLTAGWMLKR